MLLLKTVLGDQISPRNGGGWGDWSDTQDDQITWNLQESEQMNLEEGSVAWLKFGQAKKFVPREKGKDIKVYKDYLPTSVLNPSNPV